MPIPQLKIKIPDSALQSPIVFQSLAPSSLPGSSESPEPEARGSGKGKKILWIVVGILGLLFVLVVILFFTSDRAHARLVHWFPMLGSRNVDPLLGALTELRLESVLEGNHSWLFVLQDVQHPRPGGGDAVLVFALTTQGRVITSLGVHTISSLPAPSPSALQVPEPYRVWVGSRDLTFANAAMFSEFADTARQYRALYRQARGGDTPPADIVVALNSTVLPDLLTLFGSLTVESISVTPESIFDLLGFTIPENLLLADISPGGRSVFFEEVMRKLSQRIFAATPGQLERLVRLLSTQIQEREVQLFFTDRTLAQSAERLNATGTVVPTTSDSLWMTEFSSDTRLTNRALRRSFKYAVTEEDRGLVGALVLTYEHSGYFDWKTDAYQGVVRIFLPAFASAISVKTVNGQGIFEPLAPLVIGSEAGKTAVTIPVRVAPKATRVIALDYLFSRDQYHEFLFTGSYRFFIQKAPGLFPNVSLQFDFQKPITKGKPSGKIVNGNYTFETTLASDVSVELEY